MTIRRRSVEVLTCSLMCHGRSWDTSVS